MKVGRREIIRVLAVSVGFSLLAAAIQFILRTRNGLSLDGSRRPFPAAHRPYQKPMGLLRPPGALSEPDFLSACIRCYRCQDVCEPGAIHFYTERDGALLHTPYVDPAKAGCTLCNKCGPICPTGALVAFDDKADVDMGSVELSEDLCLSFKALGIRQEQELLTQLGKTPMDSQAVAERRGPCGECYMFCPLRGRAIKLVPGGFLAPIIFPDECVGCGMCEDICRTVVRTRRLHGVGAAA